MDLKNTGRFIAERRKELGLTQSKLAEKLNISEKTVSKWECGKGFPDTSIILPLCAELGVSSNELLSAKLLSDEEYKNKAEENLITLKAQNTKNNKMFFRLELYMVVFSIIVLFAAAIFMEYSLLPFGINLAFFIFSGVSVLVTCFFATIIECKIGFYRCKHCEHKFIPSYKTFIFAPHMGFTRKMTCPNCGKKDWCKKVV